MSNLIQNNQRNAAQEPEAQPAPLPKPPRRLQEFDLQDSFEQGFDPSNKLAGLEIASEEQLQTDYLQPGESVEFAAPEQKSVVGLTNYFGDKLGAGGVQVQIPEVPAASTPPMTNLWKDATTDLGVPNLADQRLITTAYPRPYADPLTYGNQFGSTETFVQGAAANAQADAQANAERTAALAKAAQDFQNARGNLPNTPDASKPWHEQLWGWAGDFLQGTEQERAEEERTGKGTFGAYGSGLGGFFKSVFGVPIAAATATFLETWGRDEYQMQRRLLSAGNPTVRTERVTTDGKRMSVEVPFNSLSSEERHKYLTEVVSNRLPLGTGALVRTNVDFRKAFGTYIYDAFAGNVNDSINEANPKLAPVIERRTGKPAVAKPARGLLQSANLRPGQEWFEDGKGSALEIATQLFSPGNKVDAAGELLGLGFKLLARTNAAQATGRAITNAVPKPAKQAVRALAGAGKRTAQAIQQGNFGNRPSVAPISQPTQVVGVPKNPGLPINKGTAFEAYIRQQPPVVPNVPAFVPERTPYAPKTDPEGLAAVVGIGQKGKPIAFLPSVEMRTHNAFVQQLQQLAPAKFGTYKGSTWEDWAKWKQQNLSTEDLRQLEAVGSPLFSEDVLKRTTQTNELNPPRLQMEATLDDLQTQQRRVVEQKLSIDNSLKQLEDTFDDLVDVGRREVDELPLRTLADADVQKAIDYNASLRLSRALPPAVVDAAAKGQWEQVQAQAEALGGMQAFLELHNRSLQDLSSVVQVPATTNLTKALPPVVYHGTALQQWQAYNLTEFGSRGELGSALYTTALYDEAVAYSQATVGNNRSVEIAYEPLAPQVLEFSTSNLRAPLDARLSLSSQDELVQSLLRNLPPNVREQMQPLPERVAFADFTEAVDVAAAKAGGSEEVLQQTSASLSDTLRAQGYDSVHDPNSGWVAVVDNGKLELTNATPTKVPTATEAAVARYNSDSLAAGAYPTHATSDANLRDSTYQLLDTARNQLDERLEEVQQKLTEATSKEEPVSTSSVAKSQGYDELRARVKEPPSVERYMRDIQEFGQPLHPVILEELPLNPRTGNPEFRVVGNAEAYSAAVASYHPRDYSMVGAMVKGTKERVAGMSAGERYYLVDIRAIKGKNATNVPPATTKEQVLKEFSSKNPGFSTAPVVLEQTSFESFRVLDRGYTANAYKQLYAKGERGAEMVPSMVIDKSGKVNFYLVDLAAIEKKAKDLEAPVPKVEELTALEKRKEAIVNYLRIPSDDKDVADMWKAVERERQWVAEAAPDELEEASEALANAELGYAVAYLQKSSAFVPNISESLKKADAVLEQISYAPHENTIVDALRISYQETKRLQEYAQALKENPTNVGFAKRFEGSLLLYEKKITVVAGAKAVEPELPKLTQEVKEAGGVQKLDITDADSVAEKAKVDKLSYKELQKKTKELGLGGKGTKVELQNKLKAHYGQTKPQVSSVVERMVVDEPALSQKPQTDAQEPTFSNPHTSLRDALDSTVDDSPNVCKF